MLCCRPVHLLRSHTLAKPTFPADVRLRGRTDFQRVFQRPTRLFGAGYVVLARPNTQESARLGLAISKRCAPGAVERNRLKRIARESFRLARPELPAVDIVIQCTRDAPNLANHQLRQTLRGAWLRLRSVR